MAWMCDFHWRLSGCPEGCDAVSPDDRCDICDTALPMSVQHLLLQRQQVAQQAELITLLKSQPSVPALAERASDRMAPETMVISVADAAAMLDLDERVIRNMWREGVLAGGQRGGRIRLLRASVVAWASGRCSGSRSRSDR